MVQNLHSTTGSSETSYFPVGRSFVVQIEAHVEINKGQLNGRIEHIVTGKSTRFHSSEQLFAFIEINI